MKVRFRCPALLIIALLAVGCTAEPIDDTFDVEPDAGVDTNTDTDHHPDAGNDAESDADADDIANNNNQSPPPDWDCEPAYPFDLERYDAVEDLDGIDLVIGLSEKIRGHTNPGYNAVRDYMFNDMEVRDDGKLECIYTLHRMEPDGSRFPGPQGEEFNTEHSWPQSRGASQEPERSDLHHLFPANAAANSARAAYEFGHVDCNESTCDWHEGGSFLGPSANDNRDPVFQVRPDRRGDVARVLFYFSIRYGHSISSEEETVLRQWHCEDPPDEYERERNDNIEAVQNNRNPFIDRPDLVDRIDEF